METVSFRVIAHIKTDFPEKFGIPRQSGLAKTLKGTVIFEPEYRDAAALKGLEGYSRLWLLWLFSRNQKEEWSATVRPPRLGGNRRMGVFATRSPYRPNPVGLSSVELIGVRNDPKYGTVLDVSGIDMADGTPILDIKPYLAYADAFPEAKSGFTDEVVYQNLSVDIPREIAVALPQARVAELTEILSEDPRPHYQEDPERIYGFLYAEYEIKFRVQNGTATVISIDKIPKSR